MTASLVVPDVQRSPHPSDQMANYYRDKMRAGELTVGDLLPATRDLIQEWGVSTHTAQRAMRKLREEGLIVTRPAKPPLIVAVPT